MKVRGQTAPDSHRVVWLFTNINKHGLTEAVGSDSISRAAGCVWTLHEKKIKCSLANVAHEFHSTLLQHTQTQLSDIWESVIFLGPETAVNSTGGTTKWLHHTTGPLLP